MAEQGGCDVRAKECKPCGRQTRVGEQRREGRRERVKYGEREVSEKEDERQEVDDRWCVTVTTN